MNKMMNKKNKNKQRVNKSKIFLKKKIDRLKKMEIRIFL